MWIKTAYLGVCALVLAACGPGVQLEKPRQDGRAVSSRVQQFERELLAEVNRLRASKGLPLLKAKRSIAQVARDHSRFLVVNEDKTGGDRTKFAHYNFSRRVIMVRQLGHGFVGEVVLCGWGQQSVSHAKATLQGWLDSPDHRRTLLDKNYTMIGLGCAYSPQNKGFYACGILAGPAFAKIPGGITF